MCGIVGIVNLNSPQPVLDSVLTSMLEKIIFRGPDEQKVFISDDKQVGLGVARLSFLDLEQGSQPMESLDKNGVIAYNGEVYDFKDQKHYLETLGYRFRTQTDTEYVLNSYLKDRVDSFKTFNGEFAFSIYNKINRSVVLARDRFGIKPLYYTIFSGKLIFASEMKAILAYPGIKIQLNFRTIVEQLMRADSLARTLFEGVHIVPPGHFIYIIDGKYSIQKYWDLVLPTLAEEDQNRTSFASYKQRLDSALTHAVKIRIASDQTIGCFLSGGLDSSIIASLMQNNSDQPVHTFSIQFQDQFYDESHYATIVANHIQSEHHILSLSDKDLVEAFPKALYHCEHLTQQIDGAGKYLLAQMASKYVKGILVGEGADELFLGYPWFKVIKYLQNRAIYRSIIAQEATRKGLDLTIDEHNHIEKYTKQFGYYPISLGNITQMENFAYTLFSKDRYADQYDPINIYYEDLDANQMYGRSIIRQNQYEFIKKTLPYYIFQFLGGKVEMANSLESRLPFFDSAIVDLVTEIPDKYLLCGLNEKYILKEIYKKKLPKEVTCRVKQGYASPILQGFLGNKAPEYFKDLLSKKVIQTINIFCPTAVHDILKVCSNCMGSMDQLTTLYERAIIFILSVHLMHKIYVEKECHLFM